MSSNTIGQIITVKVDGTKRLLFEKNEDYFDFIYGQSNIIIGGIDINKECLYVFDIKNKKWNFFKNGIEYGFVPFNSIKENKGVYTITYNSFGKPPHQNTVVTQIFIIDFYKDFFMSAYHDNENPYRKVDLPETCELTLIKN
ncbi:MAG: hypothetical protein P8L20_02865 [Flavobacteriales bacterium]|nr:hypothetical protein [Flavobacteriales bacterium]